MKALLATALAVLFACPAIAAPNCAATSDVYDILKQKFGESRAGYGISNADYVLEVWANPETQTWTVIATRTDGQSCILSEGTNYKAIPQGDPA